MFHRLCHLPPPPPCSLVCRHGLRYWGRHQWLQRHHSNTRLCFWFFSPCIWAYIGKEYIFVWDCWRRRFNSLMRWCYLNRRQEAFWRPHRDIVNPTLGISVGGPRFPGCYKMGSVLNWSGPRYFGVVNTGSVLPWEYWASICSSVNIGTVLTTNGVGINGCVYIRSVLI